MSIIAIILSLILFVIIHELGHWIFARLLGFKTPVFSIGFGRPYFVVGRLWETEFRITPWLLGGFVSIPELVDEIKPDPTVKLKRFPILHRAIVIVGGVAMNCLTAFLIIFLMFAMGGEPQNVPKDVFVVNSNPQNRPGQNSLVSGDIITSVNGKAIKTFNDVHFNNFAPNKALRFVVKRGGLTQSVLVMPDANGQVALVLGEHAVVGCGTKLGVFPALIQAGTITFDKVGEMYKGMAVMAHLLPLPPGETAHDNNVHGAVGVIEIGSQAWDQSFYSFTWILAMISLNLAVFNLLPVPMLDGGHLLFLGVEAVQRRAVTINVRYWLSVVALVALMFLTLLGLFNDIFRPIQY